MSNSESSTKTRDSTGTRPSVTPDGDEELPGRRLNSKQNLRRVFGGSQIFGAGFNVIGIVPSVASVLMFSLPGGGTHGMIWAWLVCAIFMTVISLAIAEIVSMAPNAGGMYYSLLLRSPSRKGRLAAWIVGYANAIGNIANFSAVSWACAMQIVAGAMIGSGFMFQPTMAQTFGIYCGLLIIQGIFCSLKSTVSARIQVPFLAVNILFWLGIIIALPIVTAPGLNTTKFVFGTFTNVNKAWSNNVFAFLLTFLSPIWALGRATSITHLHEEYKTHGKSNIVPYAIVTSTASNAVMSWVLMIVLAFCMGNNLRAVLFSQSGEPMATIMLNSFGRSGMLASWTFVIILQFNAASTMLLTTSRQIFAFSRDGALKYSVTKHLSTINNHTQLPFTVVWSSILLSLLLGLLAFAGTNAICRTLFSLAVTGQFVAYTMGIIGSRYINAVKDLNTQKTFNLRFMSLPIAMASCVFMTVMGVILLFPDTEHPTGGTMNYAVAILGGTIFLALVDFYFADHNAVNYFGRPSSASGLVLEKTASGEHASASQ